MTQARYLGLRLFLEGIEVDVIQATVRGGIQQPGSAQISIPATDNAHAILPRTLVHLFYIESSYHLDETSNNVTGTDLRKNLDLANSKNWRLLFTGEVRGYKFTKVGGVRQISLTCQDATAYWQQAQIYWGTGKTSLNSFKQTVFNGATQLHRGKQKVDSTGDLIRLLRARPSTNPTLPGLLGGIVALLESTTGVYDAASKRRFRGVNDFMSQAELRLHLTRMIGAASKDDTSSVFLRSSGFRKYLRRVSRSVKSTASFMDLVGLLLSKIYHQWSSVPAPPFIDSNATVTTRIHKSTGVKYVGNTKVVQLYRDVLATQKVVTARYNAANKSKRTARLMVVQAGDADPLLKVNTRGQARLDHVGHGAFNSNIKSARLSSRTARDIRSVGIDLRKEVDAKKSSPSQKAGQRRRVEKISVGCDYAVKAVRLLTIIMRQESAGHLGHTRANFILLRGYLNKAAQALSKGVGTPYKTVTKEIPVQSRLNAFLFSPDLYMVPPPKCNVLFPEHVQSITFGQDYLSEITRLWLHGRTAYGRDKKDMYFSPNTSILGGPKSADATAAVKKGVSFIMEHELYTGIIPSIEGLGDNGVFKKINKRAIRADKKRHKGVDGSDVAGQALHSPQEHLQRAANYLFFAKRFATRSMSVTCRYSPQIVAGLPVIVLDPVKGESRFAFGSKNVDSLIDNPPEGTHYIGAVHSVTHVLTSGGGAQTVLDLVKVRRHNEGIDLFGGTSGKVGETTVIKTKLVARRKKVPTNVSADRGAYSAYDGKTVGTKNMAATEPEGFTAKYNPKYNSLRDTVRGELDEIDGFVRDPKKKYLVKVRRDFPEANVRIGQMQTAVSGNGANDPPTFGKYRVFSTAGNLTSEERKYSEQHNVYVDIYEVSSSKRKRQVTFAFEDTATPPWFSTIYQAQNIGSDYYSEMLGCLSVLDTSLFTGADLKTNEDGEVVSAVIEFDTNDGTSSKEVTIPADIATPPITVEQACNNLAETWLGLKEMGADIDLFVDTYTNRKFATLYTMLGNQNGYLLANDKYRTSTPLPDLIGFHGNAFGYITQLQDVNGARLDYEPLYKLNGKGKVRNVDTRVDPRAGRYEKVEDYVDDLRTRGT
jgi:hypothetical protein